MKITIVGGGNVGTQFTVHFSQKGHIVTLYTSKPDLFKTTLSVVNEEDEVILKSGKFIVTNSPKDAFSFAEIIFITSPAFMLQKVAEEIYPYVKNNIKIVIVPGTGGAEWAFKDCINAGAELFGLQRVPSVARLVEYGSIVRASGYRNQLYLGSISSKNSLINMCGIISDVFKIPCNPLPNYLSVSLTPSNPILHTARLYNLFKSYNKDTIYEKIPLFYEDWNNETSDLLLAMDEELQNICRNLNEFDLKNVLSLKLHYESPTSQQLTNKIKSISSFKGLLSPMKKVENGFIPDFTSRYFSADFPYGLAILVQIAFLTDIKCFYMNEVLNWYKKVQPDSKLFNFMDFGIYNREDFIKHYLIKNE